MKPPKLSGGTSSPRELALTVLHEVEAGKATVTRCLDSLLESSGLSREDRSLATDLAYGTVRRQNTLDWMIASFSTTSPEDMPAWIRLILRMAAYQAAFMDRIPEHAIVNEAVKLAKVHGHSGTVKLVNALGRALAKQRSHCVYPDKNTDPVGHISLKASHPQWLIERWLEEFGFDETLALAEANNSRPPLTLRVNTLKTDRASFAATLEKAGHAVAICRHSPEGISIEQPGKVGELPGYRDGLFSIQDEAAMLVSHLVAPQPDEKILDLCAGPGGKTTHIAQLMQNKGLILAIDNKTEKVRKVEDSVKRLGTSIVKVMEHDVLTPGEALTERYDRVLLDAPCSNLGVLRRRVEARWRIQPEDITRLSQLQQHLLEAAASFVKRGGVLVYATCTLTHEENQDVVESFLSAHQDFIIEDLPPLLAPFSFQGKRGLLFLSMLHHHRIDGAFGARMRRQG